MSYNIFIADYNKTTVLQLPIIPSKLPSLSNGSKNEEFETYNDGTYNFIEKNGLQQFTLEGWLPKKASKYFYSKSKVGALEIINLINSIKDKAEPVQIVINDTNNQTYVNNTFSIESWNYNVMGNGDYEYSLGVKQWRPFTTVVTTTSITLGWGQDSTGWYFYYDSSGNYYKDSWQLLQNEWYSFDPQGYARQSAWLQDGGVYYYLKDSCKMARNEWLQISNVWYYFGSDGAMYSSGSYTIDGVSYTFDSTGAWIG